MTSSADEHTDNPDWNSTNSLKNVFHSFIYKFCSFERIEIVSPSFKRGAECGNLLKSWPLTGLADEHSDRSDNQDCTNNLKIVSHIY